MLLVGLVFFTSLLIVAVLVLGLWLVRGLWARLMGQPVSPWVFRVDPRAQWNRFNRGPGTDGRSTRAGPEHVTDVTDVTDVVAREIEPPVESKARTPDRSS